MFGKPAKRTCAELPKCNPREAAWQTRSRNEMAPVSPERQRQTFLSFMAPDCHGVVSGSFLWPQEGLAMVDRGSGIDHLDHLTSRIDGGVGTSQLIKVGLTKTTINKVLSRFQQGQMTAIIQILFPFFFLGPEFCKAHSYSTTSINLGKSQVMSRRKRWRRSKLTEFKLEVTEKNHKWLSLSIIK